MKNDALTHLFFDIETLGTRPGSLILSLACVPFQFETRVPFKQYLKDGLYIKFDPLEQIKSGRIVDRDTVNWWKAQGEEAKKVTMSSKDDVSVDEGFDILKTFIDESDYDPKESYVWSRGCYFDFPIIESLYDSKGVVVPYNGWKIRDARTFFDVFGGSNRGEYNLINGTPPEFVKHNSLHDAALDSLKMVELYSRVAEESQDDIPF